MNFHSLEERTVDTEVVESYIPLMQEGIFKGAVEVYYDITENMEALSELLNNLKIIISVFSLVVLIGLLNILFKSSRNTLIKEIAESSLQEAHSELEQIVTDRTIDLEKTNHSLMHEIQERKNTAMSLQRSNDTQTIVNKLLRESLGEIGRASGRERV